MLEVKDLEKIAVESKLIIEQFQKLLGVYTTTEAFTRIVEIQNTIDKYSKFIDGVYEIVCKNCTDVGETFAGLQDEIEELRSNVK